jgi:ribosome biogenesis GTPase
MNPASVPLVEGRIVKAQSGFFTVESEEGRFICHLRGRLKQKRLATDVAAVGDRVRIRRASDGTARIEEVSPRQSVLSRRSPRQEARKPGPEQVLVANPDQTLFVFACAEPSPHLRMLDRFLIAAERFHLPALVCANKIDLVGRPEAETLFERYRAAGYPVLYTSAQSGEGVEQVREALCDKLTVLSGPSGAGKSSLLNRLCPGLGLRVSRISRATSKGRHTTVVPEIFALDFGGYVADTPGLKAMALWDVGPEDLEEYFPEMRPFLGGCAFNNCTHDTEPGCLVKEAVLQGRIHPERYDSYLRLRRGQP